MPTLNESSYAMHKKAYIAPVVSDQWDTQQDELKKKIEKVRECSKAPFRD